MNLIFITEARFIRLSDGSVYSLESSFAYPLFQRYLKHFEKIIIFARVKEGVLNEVILTNRVTKEGVQVVALPYYVGFNAFIKKYISLRSSIHMGLLKYLDSNTTVICRIPGRVGATAISFLRRMNKPYGIEVVGDPYDVLSNGATKHPLRSIIRIFSFKSLKQIAKNAPAALYVTKYKLQERYPCNHFSVGASDVEMGLEAFINEPRKLFTAKPFKIVCVGTLEQLYKAPDIIIKSIQLLTNSGVDCYLTWVGSGKYQAEMEELALRLGVGNRVRFAGKLSGGVAVRDELDKADIYVMASRMEGLPRAMVEAMARALPCIGTNICGIPELISPECIIPINDPSALAEKIEYFEKNPSVAEREGVRNLMEAKKYKEELLGIERAKFYNYLKSLKYADSL